MNCSKYYFMYENLKAIKINPLDDNLEIKLLNSLYLIYYVLSRKVPISILFIFLKNTIINWSFNIKIFVIMKNQNVIHYTVIQNRKNQYLNLSNCHALEIGPSHTIFNFRNRGLYTYMINFLIQNLEKKLLFAIVRVNNVESNQVFKKFNGTHKMIIKYRFFISFYKN
jgi:hypothetical protein